MPDTKTYSLTDMGIVAEDLDLLFNSGYNFDKTSGITAEERNDILAYLYSLKMKQQKQAAAPEKTQDSASVVPFASPEEYKQYKYDLDHGKELTLAQVAASVKSNTVINKPMQMELARLVTEASKAEKIAAEDVAPLKFLMDTLNKEYVRDVKNPHSIQMYNSRFEELGANSAEVLNKLSEKLATVESSAPQKDAEPAKTCLSRKDVMVMRELSGFYLEKPENIVKDQKYHDIHNNAFADYVAKVEGFISDYAEGKVDIEPEAFEEMEKILDMYSKDFVKSGKNNRVVSIIKEASAGALQRLAYEKKAHNEKISDEAAKEVENGKHYTDEYKGLIVKMVNDIEGAGNDEAKKALAVREFNENVSKSMDEHGRSSEAVDQNRSYLEAWLEKHPEHSEANKYLTDEYGRLRDDVAVYVAPENRKLQAEKSAETKQDSRDDDEKVIVAPVVAPKKKGLFARIGESKFGQWCKRNWKKVAVGGALLLATVLGAKRCGADPNKITVTIDDDGNKAPTEQVVQKPQITPKDDGKTITLDEAKYDVDMLHQYAKRIGKQDNLTPEQAMNRTVEDFKSFSKVSPELKSKLPGNSDAEKMALMAMARGNNPGKMKSAVDDIIKGTDNYVTVSKVALEASKFCRNGDKLDYVHKEDFTKDTGTQSIQLSDNFKQNIVNALNNQR